MFDVVSAAMLFIVPVLAYSVYLARFRRDYRRHKVIQLSLGLLLLVAVLLFEVDVRLHDWRQRTVDSPYYGPVLDRVLGVHLSFAVSTSVLWLVTIIGALRRFPAPPARGAYSSRHRRLGWLATLGMFATSVTGWTFYYMAFIAR